MPLLAALSLSLSLSLSGQVFNVLLNDMPVITNLDIYARVGKAVAHDEVVPFAVEGGRLSVVDGSADFDGTLSIQFAKASTPVCVCVSSPTHLPSSSLQGPADNPKVNAIVVIKGPFQQNGMFIAERLTQLFHVATINPLSSVDGLMSSVSESS